MKNLLKTWQEIKRVALWSLSRLSLPLTLMLLVAHLVNTKRCIKTQKITENLANGYLSESTWRELSNEYQDDRVSSFSQESCILVLWMKVVSAMEGLRDTSLRARHGN